MIRTICVLVASAAALAAIAFAADSPNAQAPTVDRVSFPKGYQDKYAVLRTVNKPDDARNRHGVWKRTSGIDHRTDQLPYPYGSIIVMETATATKDSQGKPIVDKNGTFSRGKVLGLHVMRGSRASVNHTARTERASGRMWNIGPTRPTYATAKVVRVPECHVKAGRERDFVYRGRLPATLPSDCA